MKRTGVLAMILVMGLAGCSGKVGQGAAVTELPLLTSSVAPSPPPSEPASTPGQAPPGAPKPPVKALQAPVEASVRRVARGAVAATVVFDRRSSTVVVSENADRPFHAGSLVKVLIAMDALRRHPTDQDVRKSVFAMIQYSDDDIASRFWVSEDGGAVVIRMAHELSLSNTRPPERPGQWGDTWVTADDLVKVYNHLLNESPAADRETIVDAMAAATPAGSDGFKQHFGIPTGISQKWAVKQAWTNTNREISAHSTGLVGEGWPYIVILLTEHPRTQGWPVATRSVTAAAQTVAPLLRR
jgi:hypothetical protein